MTHFVLYNLCTAPEQELINSNVLGGNIKIASHWSDVIKRNRPTDGVVSGSCDSGLAAINNHRCKWLLRPTRVVTTTCALQLPAATADDLNAKLTLLYLLRVGVNSSS